MYPVEVNPARLHFSIQRNQSRNVGEISRIGQFWDISQKYIFTSVMPQNKPNFVIEGGQKYGEVESWVEIWRRILLESPSCEYTLLSSDWYEGWCWISILHQRKTFSLVNIYKKLVRLEFERRCVYDGQTLSFLALFKQFLNICAFLSLILPLISLIIVYIFVLSVHRRSLIWSNNEARNLKVAGDLSWRIRLVKTQPNAVKFVICMSIHRRKTYWVTADELIRKNSILIVSLEDKFEVFQLVSVEFEVREGKRLVPDRRRSLFVCESFLRIWLSTTDADERGDATWVRPFELARF